MYLKIKKFITSPVFFYLMICLIVNVLTYNGTRLFTKEFYHYDMTTSADKSIPFLPWTITIYLGCYAFWFINYIFGCTQARENAEHFLCAEVLAKLICCLCFVIIPTTNIRPILGDTGIFNKAMAWLYRNDAADNLFPSIHCLTSWFCVIAIRKQKKIPLWYKILSVVIAFAICISTLTTRQHVIADAIAGVLLAEFCFHFVKLSGFLKWYRHNISSLFILIKKKLRRFKKTSFNS